MLKLTLLILAIPLGLLVLYLAIGYLVVKWFERDQVTRNPMEGSIQAMYGCALFILWPYVLWRLWKDRRRLWQNLKE